MMEPTEGGREGGRERETGRERATTTPHTQVRHVARGLLPSDAALEIYSGILWPVCASVRVRSLSVPLHAALCFCQPA